MTNRYSIAEARDQLASLIHDAEKGVPVELTRRGKPVAVLVSLHEYQRLLASKQGFWDSLSRFRQSKLFHHGQVTERDLADLRDSSPGREVGW